MGARGGEHRSQRDRARPDCRRARHMQGPHERGQARRDPYRADRDLHGQENEQP
jgi:hypothetical protein